MMLDDCHIAMSATERSRLFRERHPGYDARRKATQRASIKRTLRQMALAQQIEHAATVAAEAEQEAEAVVERREPQVLPAPAELIALPLLLAMVVRQKAECVGRLRPDGPSTPR